MFVNDAATTEIYTLSLHDALPICGCGWRGRSPDENVSPHRPQAVPFECRPQGPRRLIGSQPTGHSPSVRLQGPPQDRKSTRLNSSHANISYAVFCLKKKNTRMYTK